LPEGNQDCKSNNLEIWEELEKEEELLFHEKNDLMAIEKHLWLRINDATAIEKRKQRNKELKREVELLRRNCEELIAALNRSDLSPAFFQQLGKDIEELEINNKTAREAISTLQIRKNDLEAKLKERV
jgi:hypothetical protein